MEFESDQVFTANLICFCGAEVDLFTQGSTISWPFIAL